MQDAILVVSNWTFEANNVPERMARGLALNGVAVYYLRNPLSILRYPQQKHCRLSKNLFYFDTRFMGLRIAHSRLGTLLWEYVAKSVKYYAKRNGHKIAYVIFHDVTPVAGFPFLDYFHRLGAKLIHLNIDVTDKFENAVKSNIIFSIPPISRSFLEEKFPGKVYPLPQFGPLDSERSKPTEISISSAMAELPHPLLTYLGAPSNRLDWSLLKEVISSRQEWTFAFTGKSPYQDLANVKTLPWMGASEMAALLSVTDVGVMPYNCTDPMQFGCVPLKLFDYFLHGLPVVSTSIDYVTRLNGLVYHANTPAEFESAVELALKESLQSSLRLERISLAEGQNAKAIARQVLEVLKIE